MSSPRINGSAIFGDPVESEGGVFSCPFDKTQRCQLEPIFQTKDGELLKLPSGLCETSVTYVSVLISNVSL